MTHPALTAPRHRPQDRRSLPHSPRLHSPQSEADRGIISRRGPPSRGQSLKPPPNTPGTKKQQREATDNLGDIPLLLAVPDEGFEPSKGNPADLQSASFGRSDNLAHTHCLARFTTLLRLPTYTANRQVSRRKARIQSRPSKRPLPHSLGGVLGERAQRSGDVVVGQPIQLSLRLVEVVLDGIQCPSPTTGAGEQL